MKVADDDDEGDQISNVRSILPSTPLNFIYRVTEDIAKILI
jgi:hypothetical protein